MKRKIIFATSNKGKIREIKEILKDENCEVLSLEDAGIDVDIIEDGDTFEENALIKANTVMKLTDNIVLADDSGLEVDYLNKEPGIYSARYLGENVSQEEKNQYIINQLNNVEDKYRTARFVCTVACAIPGKESFTVRGTMEGIIAKKAAGHNGFGYDPIFIVPKFNKTVAEMDADDKNNISHRGEALRLMKNKLIEIGVLS